MNGSESGTAQMGFQGLLLLSTKEERIPPPPVTWRLGARAAPNDTSNAGSAQLMQLRKLGNELRKGRVTSRTSRAWAVQCQSRDVPQRARL